MRLFLICLSPSLLAYAIVLVASSGDMADSSFTPSAVLLLLVIGGLLSGVCVGRHVFRKTDGAVFLKWLLAVLTFAGVATLYFALALAGCCGVALIEGSFR
ncbi:MAG: hypothetical protein GXX91_08650 [Verrucomicrobiaceae bacterium]|nr:hypothetical protein [Verrucomicrobiaceae bacterium]